MKTRRMECLRTAVALANPDLSSAARDIIMRRRLRTSNNNAYKRAQTLFLTWAPKAVDVHRFSKDDLVSFLSWLHVDRSFRASTLRMIKSAVLMLHLNPLVFSNCQTLQVLFTSISMEEPPIRLHRPIADLTPTFRAVAAVGATSVPSLAQAQQKMAFLLALTCFLRPSDVQRIDNGSLTIAADHNSLTFDVVAPKETRRQHRIIKSFMVRAHQDPALCPVAATRQFLNHPRLSQLNVTVRDRLLVNVFHPDRPLQSTTISSCWFRRWLKMSTDEPMSVRSLAFVKFNMIWVF